MRSNGHRAYLRLSVVLLAMLSACAPVGIAEDWRVGMVKVYNRTLQVISFEHGWVPICSENSWFLPDWTPAPTVTPPAGAIHVDVDPGVPADFRGVVSVIVSEAGIDVVRGFPNEPMAACSGQPPVGAEPQ